MAAHVWRLALSLRVSLSREMILVGAGRSGQAGQGRFFNQVIYWSRLPDWKIQTLTPNPDAIYLTPFTNTAEPPMRPSGVPLAEPLVPDAGTARER